jgi:thiamine pyrophosphate-dependent acetolactate synthase large subunit-like protein
MAKQIAKTGADVVVEALEARGTTHVFGVLGAKIDRIVCWIPQFKP